MATDANHTTKPIFRKLPFGSVLRVNGVPIKIEWANRNGVTISVPAELAPAFRPDGRQTMLTCRMVQ